MTKLSPTSVEDSNLSQKSCWAVIVGIREDSINFVFISISDFSYYLSQKKLLSCYAAMGKSIKFLEIGKAHSVECSWEQAQLFLFMAGLLFLHLNENGTKWTTNRVPWFPEKGCTGDAIAEDAHSLPVL